MMAQAVRDVLDSKIDAGVPNRRFWGLFTRFRSLELGYCFMLRSYLEDFTIELGVDYFAKNLAVVWQSIQYLQFLIRNRKGSG